MMTSIIGVSSNTNKKGSFSDINNVVSDNSGFPSLPIGKSPQQTFVKEKINSTNPMTVPDMNRAHFKGMRLEDQHNTKAKVKDPISSEAVEDYENNAYLIPVDPPTYMESGHDFNNANFSSSSGSSDTSTNSFHKWGRPFQRIDSGVGDCDSVQGSSNVRFSTSPSSSSHSMSNPRLSTQYEQQYEDIDQYNRSHEQQQQPQHQPRRSSTEKFRLDSVRSGLQQQSHVDLPDATNSDAEDNLIIDSSLAEAVSEPMHDPRVGSLPHPYMPLNTCRHPLGSWKPAKIHRGCSWFIILLIIVLVISLTALSLSIYVLVSKLGKSDNSDKDTSENTQIPFDFGPTVSSLQEKIDDLVKENAALKKTLMTQQNNLTSYIEQEVVQLSSQQQNLNNTLQLMQVKFDAEITNISLKPGPQGPPGVVNFSLCVNRSISRSASPSAVDATETSYLPSESEIQDYFVTFAYCTYSGATDAYLETQSSSTNNRQRYRCKCWGTVPGKSRTVCAVTIWMCPHGH